MSSKQFWMTVLAVIVAQVATGIIMIAITRGSRAVTGTRGA